MSLWGIGNLLYRFPIKTSWQIYEPSWEWESLFIFLKTYLRSAPPLPPAWARLFLLNFLLMPGREIRKQEEHMGCWQQSCMWLLLGDRGQLWASFVYGRSCACPSQFVGSSVWGLWMLLHSYVLHHLMALGCSEWGDWKWLYCSSDWAHKKFVIKLTNVVIRGTWVFLNAENAFSLKRSIFPWKKLILKETHRCFCFVKEIWMKRIIPSWRIQIKLSQHVKPNQNMSFSVNSRFLSTGQSWPSASGAAVQWCEPPFCCLGAARALMPSSHGPGLGGWLGGQRDGSRLWDDGVRAVCLCKRGELLGCCNSSTRHGETFWFMYVEMLLNKAH